MNSGETMLLLTGACGGSLVGGLIGGYVGAIAERARHRREGRRIESVVRHYLDEFNSAGTFPPDSTGNLDRPMFPSPKMDLDLKEGR